MIINLTEKEEPRSCRSPTHYFVQSLYYSLRPILVLDWTARDVPQAPPTGSWTKGEDGVGDAM